MRSNSKCYTIETVYNGRLYNAEIAVTIIGNTSDDVMARFDTLVEVSELFDREGAEFVKPVFVGQIRTVSPQLEEIMLTAAITEALNDGELISNLGDL